MEVEDVRNKNVLLQKGWGVRAAKGVQRGREGNRRREEGESEMEEAHHRRDGAETSSEAPACAVAPVSFLCRS